MMKYLRRFWLFFLIIAIDIAVWLIIPPLGQKIGQSTLYNFKEMLLVIPPVFVLLGLMDVWVPRETMIRFMGEGSGILGVALAIGLGSAAAGPLYGAFPIAVMMMAKGASLRNSYIFLGAWSTLKIPMFLFETAALGPVWSLTRWGASIVGTLVIAFMIDKLLSHGEKQSMRAHLTHATGPVVK